MYIRIKWPQLDSVNGFSYVWKCHTQNGNVGYVQWVKQGGVGTSSFSWALHWRHNDHDGVSNHQPDGCLLNRLFRRRSKKTSKLRVTDLCVENSPGPVNSPHKGPVTRKMFPFDDVIMESVGSLHERHSDKWLCGHGLMVYRTIHSRFPGILSRIHLLFDIFHSHTEHIKSLFVEFDITSIVLIHWGRVTHKFYASVR